MHTGKAQTYITHTDARWYCYSLSTETDRLLRRAQILMTESPSWSLSDALLAEVIYLPRFPGLLQPDAAWHGERRISYDALSVRA